MVLGCVRFRAVSIAAFFSLLALLCCGHARASVFCAADVQFLTPWDYAGNAPAAAGANLHYLLTLSGDKPGLVSGDAILVTETKAYKVALDKVDLVPSRSNPKTFESDPMLVSLPEPGNVRYAWMDDATDASGKSNTCPTFPYEVPVLDASERAKMGSGTPLPKAAHVQYDSIMASFLQNLEPLTCATPYSDPQPIGEIPKTTEYYDPSIVKDPTVEGRVDVDSAGHVLNVTILKSSGSIAFDQDAREVYGGRTYRPATFRCTPVVSSYYFKLTYSP